MFIARARALCSVYVAAAEFFGSNPFTRCASGKRATPMLDMPGDLANAKSVPENLGPKNLLNFLLNHPEPMTTTNCRAVLSRYVRFAPESGHVQCSSRCLLRAKSGHSSSYSITSLAVASSEGGTVRPSALAVLRLIASSFLVGACTGRSAAFSPLRMRST